MTETGTTVPSESVRPGHTAAGAAWRAVVILVLAAPVIAAGSWAGSKLVRFDSRFVTGPSFAAACVIGVLVALWLRAGSNYAGMAILGTVVAADFLAYLLYDGLLADGTVHLSRSPMEIVYQSLAAAGIAMVLVTVVCAAVSGHRRPR